MAEDLTIGEDDIVTVALAAVRDRLAGIEFDGEAIPVQIGAVLPADASELPVILVHSPSESYSQGAGQPGRRMERIDAVIRVTLAFSAPSVRIAQHDRAVGRTRAEVKERIAANATLRIDGKVIATDLHVQSVQKGFVPGGAKLSLVNQLQLGCVINSREGQRLPVGF